MNGAIIIEGHVQGLSNTRALGEMGIPVIVIDKNSCLARYSKYCKKFFKCPDYLDSKFINFLTELAKNETLHGWTLFPSNDHAVINISNNRHLLEKHYKIITPNSKIIETIYDKAKLLQIAENNNIPIPKTYYLNNSHDVSDEILFPVLTKGRHGLSFYKTFKKKAFLATNNKELAEQFAFINKHYPASDTFTQELIPHNGGNKTISFTAFCINGIIKAHWSGIKIREHPVRFGTATLAKSTYIEECHHQSISLLKALDYTGVCEIEYLMDPRNSQYKLIEINARTWLWVGLAKYCGINYALMIYNFLNHIDTAFPDSYEKNIYWINSITDTVFSIQSLIRGDMTLKEYISTLKKVKVSAVFSKRDIFPSVLFPITLLSRLVNR